MGATTAPPPFSATPVEATETAEAPNGGALRILAAEDNPTNQLVLKTLLAAAGLEPVFANDGREALEAWEGQTWDIVLMDIQMPQMNGIEATQAIRRRELETGRLRTPIVAVTANAMTHQVAEFHAAGLDDVVAKPVDLTSLLAAMEQVLYPDLDVHSVFSHMAPSAAMGRSAA